MPCRACVHQEAETGASGDLPARKVGGCGLIGPVHCCKYNRRGAVSSYIGEPLGAAAAEYKNVIVRIFRGSEGAEAHDKEHHTLRRLSIVSPTTRMVRMLDSSPPASLSAATANGGSTRRNNSKDFSWLALAPAWECDLEDRINNGAEYDLVTALRWGLQSAEALDELHLCAGVCHGSIDPRNVLVGMDGGVYLSGVAMSVPHYLHDEYQAYGACVAPEVAEEKVPVFRPASEVWSWGVVFYAIMARSLDAHTAADPTAFFQSLATTAPVGVDGSTPVWVDEIRGAWKPMEVPQEAFDVIVGALRNDPVERLSLRSIVKRLERALQRVESGADAWGMDGHGPLPLPSPAAEDWGDVVCQCDDRLFTLRQSPYPDHKAIGEDLVRKGWAHQKLDQPHEAERCYRGAVSSFKSADNVDYNGIATALNNLASVHLDKGEQGKALLLQEAVLRIRRHSLPADHPAIASFLTNLGSLYEMRKDYDKALPLYEEAAEIMKMVLPEGHPDIASSINNIAVLHQTRQDYDRALPLHEEALNIRRRVLPPDHPLVAASLTSLAMVHYCRGDGVAALPALKEALDIQRSTVNHPNGEGGIPGVPLEELEKIYDMVYREVHGCPEPGSSAELPPLPPQQHAGAGRKKGRRSQKTYAVTDAATVVKGHSAASYLPAPEGVTAAGSTSSHVQLPAEAPATQELGVGRRVKRRKFRDE